MKYKFNPFIGKLDSVSSNASEINYPQLGTSTYKTVEDCHNICSSSGRITGFTITAHTPADGTVDVSSGTGSIKIENTVTAQMKFFDFAGVNSIVLTNNILNYLYVDYNSGTPQILVTTDRLTVNYYDQFIIGRVFREGNETYILNTGVNIYAETRRNHDRLVDQFGFRYASGCVTSESGTRKIAVTAGRWYIDNNLITNNAFDTNISSVIESYYYNGSTWIENESATTIDNANYNDVTSGLTALGTNKYVNAWIYLTQDGKNLIWVYGQAQYSTLSDAQFTNSPSITPPTVTYFAKLIARITLRQGTTNFISISNALITSLPSGIATSHSNLSNLTADDHTQYLRTDGTRALSADWDAGSFEIRAQTLESDVATGTAPLTIASTTVNTNLNADLLDGLHDTGYTKTTAGQTINVSTEAELTSAINGLAASPSLLGNVTINLTANITTDITIPALVYNGFTLTIQGSLTTDESGIAATNALMVCTNPGAAAYATLTRAAGTWTADQHAGKLAYDGTTYYAIKGNTTTALLHAAESTESAIGAKTISIHSWTYTLTGHVTVSSDARVIFQNLKISDTESQSDGLNGTIFQKSNSNMTVIRCYIENLGTAAVVYCEGLNKFVFNHTIFDSSGTSFALRLVHGTFAESLYKNSGIIARGCTGMVGARCWAYIRGLWIVQKTGTSNTKNGIQSNTGFLNVIWIIIDNFLVGCIAYTNGIINGADGSTAYIACGTNKTPAAATDAAYVS